MRRVSAAHPGAAVFADTAYPARLIRLSSEIVLVSEKEDKFPMPGDKGA